MAETHLYSKHGEECLEWMLVSFQTHPSAFLHSGHQGREQEQCPARLRPVLGQALQSQAKCGAHHENTSGQALLQVAWGLLVSETVLLIQPLERKPPEHIAVCLLISSWRS